MKTINALVERIKAKQAARKEARRRQYAADAYAAAVSQTDYRDHRTPRHR